MKNIFPENSVNYILRLYLPTWNYEKIIADVIKFCKETGTKYVMLFTDAQHMVWNQLTIEEARHEAETIARTIRDLAQHNIKVGINSSYNMLMSRFDHSKHNPQYTHWQTLADGTCEKRLACQLDPALKDYLKEFYTILAETSPEFIYMDDDHRYIFAGRANTWGCMCDLHISEFSRCTGKNWTRETLHHAIYNDFEIRKKWMAFLKNTLEEIASVVENTVHSVNKNIKVGIMVPCLHSMTICDYDLPTIAKIAQPEGKFLLRPCIGPYCDRDRLQIIPGLFYMETIGHLMGDSAEYTPEIETTPFTRFSKSMEVIRLHISQGIVNGMLNPAISACGYVGNSPFFEPEIAKMLKKQRPYFDNLLKIAPKRNSKKGIGLKFLQRSAVSTPENHQSLSDYYWPAFTTHDFLANSGFCITYDESDVTLLAGGTVYAMTDDELKKLLSKNLILDASAAKAFINRGFKNEIGCGIEDMNEVFGAEYFCDEEFCGQYTGTYASLKDTALKDVKKITDAAPSARILSVITDHDRRKVCPSMILYSNSLGGKVAVMNYYINPVTSDMRNLINYQKQTLMRNIIESMSIKAIPAFIENPSCFALQYFNDGSKIFVGIANTSYDIADEIIITFNEPDADVANGKYLNEDGQLLPLADIAEKISDKQWKITKQLPIFHFFALQIPVK